MGEGDSRFRFIMCVISSDLAHNLLFRGTDNILGARDTSILVLPSLEVKAPYCPDNGVDSSLSAKPRAGARHRTPYPTWSQGLAHRTCQGLQGLRYTPLRAADHGLSMGDSSTALCGLGTGYLLTQGSPDVRRPRGTKATKV